jgi:hypothetical protein
MLVNQLEYLPKDQDTQLYVERILTVHGYIRNHEFTGLFDQLQAPWFLPPQFGGLGVASPKIPDWGLPYVWYIHDRVEAKDHAFLLTLSGLNDFRKYGIDVDDAAYTLINREISSLSEGKSIKDPDPFGFNTKKVFSDKLIEEFVRSKVTLSEGLDWPDVSRDIYVDYARSLGFMPISDLIDQYKRAFLFNDFMSKDVKKDIKTINQWIKTSAKFWRPIRTNPENRKYRFNHFNRIRDFSYTMDDLRKLEKKAKSTTFGYVTVDRGPLDLLQALPTMSVGHRHATVKKFDSKVNRLGLNSTGLGLY